MTTPRDIYYISGNTTILAKDMGKALLSQFPDTLFREESIPFIRYVDDAHKALDKILNQSAGRFPLIISSLFDENLNVVFHRPELHLITICDQLLLRLENILGARATRHSGTARRVDDTTLANRVNAIHYTIAHDDGTGINDYDQAELILIGVSRSGKTPVSVYLATEQGLKTANHPLVEGDLNSCHLPAVIRRNRHKVVGLSIHPAALHKFRESRLPYSRYSQLATCIKEVEQAQRIYEKYKIYVVHSDGRSIEETAMQVICERKENYPTGGLK